MCEKQKYFDRKGGVLKVVVQKNQFSNFQTCAHINHNKLIYSAENVSELKLHQKQSYNES